MRVCKILCALAGCASAALAQSSGTATRTAAASSAALDSLRLTRREAIAQALAHNPQIEVAREQTRQARARRVQAVAIPDPVLLASLDDKTQLLGTPGAKNVEVDLSVPFPDKFRLRNAVARADVQSSDFQFILLRQQIAAEAARSYDALLVSRRHARDLAEGRALADAFVQKADARFNAGSVAKLDVIRARVDLAQADNALIANERETANAEAALNRVIGRPLGTPIVSADSLDVPPPLPDLAPLEEVALQIRPELSDLEAQRNGARANIALLREYWLPDLTFTANRDYAQTGRPLFSTGLALPFPLLFWQHTNGEIAEARSRERELTATQRDLRAEVGQDVRATYAAATIALRQVLYIRDALLPAAQEAFRVASVSYGLGGSSALEVLDARRTLLDAQAQYADALAAANTARSDLERAVGRSLDTFPTGDRRE
jgi:cobalt-zinc-cadmium efflux system outer membrane protein